MKKRNGQVLSLGKQHSKVLVSVIIPIYNVERFLEKCLKSVISQTLKGIEIIAVNDGSTDNSARILKNISTTTNIIKIINSPSSPKWERNDIFTEEISDRDLRASRISSETRCALVT